MPRGVIKWFNEKKGYGFISNEEGGDVFVHYTGIQGEGFRTLNEGDKVEFEIETSEKGPRAVSVRTIQYVVPRFATKRPAKVPAFLLISIHILNICT